KIRPPKAAHQDELKKVYRVLSQEPRDACPGRPFAAAIGSGISDRTGDDVVFPDV
ncbi:hypothetical protein M427DRAFT_54679, partial [Gonapodya prolifera JEL478]